MYFQIINRRILPVLLLILCVKYSYTKNNNEICKKASQTHESNLQQQKNLLRKYADLCHISSSIFLKYANAQMLEHSYWESLWAAKRAKLGYKRTTHITKHHQAIRIQALSYIGLHREEEAITLIKDTISKEKNKQIIKKIPMEHQKLFLILIKAYFKKSKNIKHQDIQYLINKFKRMFPDSIFQTSLSHWVQSND